MKITPTKQERYEYVVKRLKHFKRMGWDADWSGEWVRLKAEKVELEKDLKNV